MKRRNAAKVQLFLLSAQNKFCALYEPATPSRSNFSVFPAFENALPFSAYPPWRAVASVLLYVARLAPEVALVVVEGIDEAISEEKKPWRTSNIIQYPTFTFGKPL
jgi:hypothetical protein